MSLRRHSQRAVHVASDAFSNGRASMALHVPSDAFSIGRVSGPRQDAFSNGMWPVSGCVFCFGCSQKIRFQIPNSHPSASHPSVRPSIFSLFVTSAAFPLHNVCRSNSSAGRGGYKTHTLPLFSDATYQAKAVTIDN